MVEALITGAFQTLPPEQLKQIKSAIAKIDEFLPIISAYHDSIPLKEGEIRVSYLLGMEGKEISLYQVVLGTNINLKMPVITRTLHKFNLLEKINEITASI